MSATTTPAIERISPQELFALRNSGRAQRLIDVRTPIEFAEVHADGAVLVPLDQLDPATLPSAPPAAEDQPIYVICKSGARAARACAKLASAGIGRPVLVQGGTDAWVAAGLPVVRGRGVISLERQVRIGAGSLALIGLLLGWLVHPWLFGISAFVAAGLIVAGITNWCGMGMLLARMPWNQRHRG